MSGVYIHIPFCETKCFYCDFYSVANHSQMDLTIESICREIKLRRDFLSTSPRTLYIGGGTPSLCTPTQLGRLAAQVCEQFGCDGFEEFTVEVNPEQLNPEYLASIRRIGVNRLSIGIQSLSDRILQFVNRKHTAAQALQAVRQAQQAGFDNISVDLIYAIPGLSISELDESISGVCELGVQHLSAYHLGIEPGTVFGRRFSEGRLSEVSEAVSNEHYGLVCRRLREAGFEHYEISNFAKSGYRSLHNSSYWQGVPYLGVGPAAHSYEGRNRYWNVANISKYISTVDSLEHIEGEILSQEDIYNEYVMTRLRTSEGIDIEDFKSRFGVESSDRLLTDSQPARKIGNIIVVDRWLRIPEEKFLISDSIISELFLG